MRATVLCRKLKKSIQLYGLPATLKTMIRLPSITLKQSKEYGTRNEIQREFDSKHNTDTGGIIPLAELSVVDNPNWIQGVRYGPTSPSRFHECLALLPLRLSEYRGFTYIDLGSGKGATLLYASHLGFGNVIGIEFAEELHRVAEENIRRYPGARGRAASIWCDATKYDFPDAPAVIFANHPFSGVLMNQVPPKVPDSRTCRLCSDGSPCCQIPQTSCGGQNVQSICLLTPARAYGSGMRTTRSKHRSRPAAYHIID